MPRPLVATGTSDPSAVLRALEAALAGGPALLPVAEGAPALPKAPPAEVRQAVALVVETSGSTGTGKRVALSSEALLAGAAAADAALGGPGRWVLALPTHYIAGLNVLTRSITAGTEPVVVAPGHFAAAAFTEAAERLVTGPAAPRRYTSLVPVQLARVLDDPDATRALAGFDAVLVGGQATPAPLRQRAHDAGVRIVTTYGASETSGGCVYDGVPFGTVRTALVDDELHLAGPMLAEGYLDDDDRTASAFVERDGLRWYRTGDTATLSGGVVRVLGRLDDVVISGGEKVQLGAVERLVRGLPGQQSAVVVRRSAGEWGEVPVVVTEQPLDPDTVRAHVGAALGRAARPADVVLVDRIPMLASGKPDRRAVQALVDPAGP
ncbi:AMP-binding protein [Curtobacterium sp. VKM Ac-2889]|uniref:AMP-binding protein n=1 Tax=Curtobacterium poinsettiae TaxID=159612 RepID=A0ABT3S4X2_9MICO|nr:MULTISPECIES: AMP-binding protein [Curtobacterium]MBF4597071.1 AMP-binding protein [Curtobacterium sp. VKM Ac-1796]MBF4609885.1 AMP-binding protein [Curtobacterium sp. VKM Ac-2889]MBT1597354.1 AMP-binding protein [Curtobacterium flaccumfaciens pv. flaccumfaciens]MBT1609624.1 AMP-binding protein [Curtobacterium flaccumfaciens pv. poinsettiae]MCX2849487.1 AMP-binding protein [Curtobacterium flaccumfaciens pv. poinsettiae]